jgi:acyl carrier protein
VAGVGAGGTEHITGSAIRRGESMSDIREVVRSFVLENFLPGEDPKNLTDDTELKESGILDSMSTLKLVSFLENRFGVEFEADDLDGRNLASLTSIEQLVQSKLKTKS